jgi:hypothetical protein
MQGDFLFSTERRAVLVLRVIVDRQKDGWMDGWMDREIDT